MKNFDFVSFSKHCEDYLTVLNSEFQFIEVNAIWMNFLKLPIEKILYTDIFENVFHEDRPMLKTLLENMRPGQFFSNKPLRLLGWANNFIYTRFSVRNTGNGFELLFRDVSQETEDAMVVQKAAQMGDLGAWSHDPVADKSYWNEVVYDIYDLSKDAPMDHDTVVSLYHPDDKTRMLTVIDRLYKEHIRYDEVTRIITPKNNLKWIRVVAEPIVNEGEILWINGFAQDVSLRQKTLQRLQQSEEQKYLALKGIKSGIFDYNLEDEEIYFSEDFGNMLGLDYNYPVKNFTDFVHPDDKAEADKRFEEGLAQPGNYFENRYRLRNVNGVYRHFEVHAWRKKNEAGKTVRMVGNLVDVEEKVKAEEERNTYLAQLEALINNGFIKSVLLDREGRVLMADSESRKLGILEYGSDAVDGHVYFGDILPVDERKRFEQELPRVLAGSKVRKEVQHVYSTGAIGWLEVIYNPVKDSVGVVTGVVISFMEIGMKKMAEIERRYNQGRMREVNRMKANIISNMSHEVRTPLNGILNVAELLPEVDDQNELNELLEIQKKSVDRLLKTIDGIVNLGKLDAEKGSLTPEKINMVELVQLCFDKLQTQALKKGLLFELKTCDVPLWVLADRLMLEQSLINVMNNAVKFTKEGGVIISCEDGNGGAQVIIEDTGVGISIENQERIFSDFEQESLGHSRAFEGSGVGLSFTKKFIELNGGQINVVSIKDEGSIFTITLPMV